MPELVCTVHDLSDLDQLVTLWTKYVASHPVPDDLGRDGGYIAGLEVCARQLAETLERIRNAPRRYTDGYGDDDA